MRSSNESRDEVAPLSEAERGALLRSARAALEASLDGLPPPEVSESRSTRLEAPGAAFVTLRVGGELRGCLGTTRFERPLREVVPELAVSAAREDYRFEAIRRDELPDTRISISVLTPLAPARLDAIEIGRHGLVVRLGGCSGLLLPQVASERGWTPEQFLAETSHKAGLPDDAWKHPDARVYWFTAECFAEAGSPV